MPAIAKPHFELGGMRVDVDLSRIDFHEQHERGLPAMKHHIAITQPDGAADQPVTQHAAVQIEMLQVGLRARVRRLT